MKKVFIKLFIMYSKILFKKKMDAVILSVGLLDERLETNVSVLTRPFHVNVPFLHPLKTFTGGIKLEHWREIG